MVLWWTLVLQLKQSWYLLKRLKSDSEAPRSMRQQARRRRDSHDIDLACASLPLSLPLRLANISFSIQRAAHLGATETQAVHSLFRVQGGEGATLLLITHTRRVEELDEHWSTLIPAYKAHECMDISALKVYFLWSFKQELLYSKARRSMRANH